MKVDIRCMDCGLTLALADLTAPVVDLEAVRARLLAVRQRRALAALALEAPVAADLVTIETGLGAGVHGLALLAAAGVTAVGVLPVAVGTPPLALGHVLTDDTFCKMQDDHTLPICIRNNIYF